MRPVEEPTVLVKAATAARVVRNVFCMFAMVLFRWLTGCLDGFWMVW